MFLSSLHLSFLCLITASLSLHILTVADYRSLRCRRKYLSLLVEVHRQRQAQRERAEREAREEEEKRQELEEEMRRRLDMEQENKSKEAEYLSLPLLLTYSSLGKYSDLPFFHFLLLFVTPYSKMY